MTVPITSSEYGACHPPYAKPPLVSSSGPPPACMTPSRVMNSSTITFLMTEFLQHLATFGADHVCSSVFPFFSLPLACGMTDGERRFSCNVHVYLFYEPRKKTAIRILLQSSARLSCGKDQSMCLTWLDERRAWVLTEVALLRIYNICVQQPASKAILRRSARSIPMFRADAPTIHLKNRRTFALLACRCIPDEKVRRAI